jgi:hypothetical protein
MVYSKILNISNNTSTSVFPAIAASGNNVHIVWMDGSPGNFDVFYKRSTDGGGTFEDIINLSNTTEHSTGISIATSQKNVYVVWTEMDSSFNSEVFYKRSTDGGGTFGEADKLSPNPASGAFVSASGNNLFVVWQEKSSNYRTHDVFYKRSTDGGGTFEDIINLSNNPGDSRGASVAVENNRVYVVWEDDSQGNNDVFYKRSTDGGNVFSFPVNLSNNTEQSTIPSVAASRNNVYVVWNEEDDLYNREVFYKRSTDGGNTFPYFMNLSKNPSNSFDPSVGTERNMVYVLWYDTAPGNSEIGLSISSDGGFTFAIPDNLSNSPWFSGQPDLATSITGDSNNVYAVWSDLPGDNKREDIFFISQMMNKFVNGTS